MHIFAILGLSFILGCFGGIKFDIVNLCVLSAFVGFVFIVKIILFKARTIGNLYIGVLILIFMSGALMGFYHHRNTFSKVSPLYGADVTLTGRVTEVKNNNFILSTDDYNLSVSMYGEQEIYEGAVVKVTGKLNSFEVAQFNGDADYRFYYALKGIAGRLYPKTVEITGYEDEFSIWDIGRKVRKYIHTKIDGYAISDKVEGLMLALLTGDTDRLDNELKENFRLTGISHLVAVSGLHMSIFLSFFLIISTRLKKNRILQFLFILTLVILYTLIIGERASILRAGIMSVMSYAIFGMKRRSDGVMNLIIAGVMICIINPYYSVDAGFQLSFVVTLGIVLYAEHFKHQTIAVPVIAMLFIMPVALYYYNTVSLESVLVNLIVVPLVPTIILFGYIGCVIPLFGFIAGTFASFVINVAGFFAGFDFLHITVPSPDLLQFIIFYLICSGIYFFLDNYKIDEMLFVLFLALIICVNMYACRNFDSKESVVKFINNGFFNMEHITTKSGKEILVDCGYKASDYAVKTGVEEIYLVLITDDEDRYLCLEDLCSKCHVRTVLMPDSMKNNILQLENSHILYYNQDDYTFYVDDVGFKFTLRDDKRCLLLSVADNVINIPLEDKYYENTYITHQTGWNIFQPMFVY